MMADDDINPQVRRWLACWQNGRLDELPIADDFQHTSPFGTIADKARYLSIVGKNQADFLDNTFTVLVQLQQGDCVCVQFEQNNHSTGLQMVVCEWYQLQDGLIQSIQSFYNVGDAEIKG
ncbi:nuclear transport factor 2 family protein [Marinicella meishanensis]|uniref:nuclear transport factor 2 family protein n=1 Tax=Marinicella meishanensis TaxID=2873263 RepID=UPI001CBEC753|nr:nuclear transport factor 2 family protein [Marinicella sp. NBU2979]